MCDLAEETAKRLLYLSNKKNLNAYLTNNIMLFNLYAQNFNSTRRFSSYFIYYLKIIKLNAPQGRQLSRTSCVVMHGSFLGFMTILVFSYRSFDNETKLVFFWSGRKKFYFYCLTLNNRKHMHIFLYFKHLLYNNTTIFNVEEIFMQSCSNILQMFAHNA